MAAILADDIFKRIFVNENDRIQNQISLKFVPDGPIDNDPALVQIMAWRRAGTKLMGNICVSLHKRTLLLRYVIYKASMC